MLPVYDDSDSEKIVGYFDETNCSFNNYDDGFNVIVIKTYNGNWIYKWFNGNVHFLITEGKAAELMETYGIKYDKSGLLLPLL